MVAAKSVADAFGIDDARPAFAKKDALPFSAAPQFSLRFVIGILVLMLVLSVLLSMCSDGGRGGYSRNSGGSWGGYSSGGGHK